MDDMDNLRKKILEWPWYDAPQMRMMFLHLLMVAEIKDRVWRNRTLRRGDVLTNKKTLPIESGFASKEVDSVLNDLISAGEIDVEYVDDFAIITINGYDDFFPKDEQKEDSQIRRIEG